MPQLPQQWNSSAAQASLAPPAASAPEYVIPLWWYSGSAAGSSATSAGSSASMLQKGTNAYGSPTGNTTAKLHSLSVNWSTSTNFALEVCANNGASYTGYVALWDFSLSTPAIVLESQISVIGVSNKTVIRSGNFTLIPGHVYGVTVWSNATQVTSVTDASLIVFPQ